MNRMSIQEMRDHEWVVSWSGGKDSTATIILMHEFQVPIKEIVYVKMMYDDTTPATLPIMSSFIDNTIERFRQWGYKVRILKGDRNARYYTDCVYYKSRYHMKNGSPYGITAFSRKGCRFSAVKARSIADYQKSCEYYEMIGYAADETARIDRLIGKKYSILLELGVIEKVAYTICKNRNMLSPLYELGFTRDGCWFCPNAGKKEREYIKKYHPELYSKIIEMYKMVRFDIRETRYISNWNNSVLD